MCVPMPTHCTITYFVFHARQIDGNLVRCSFDSRIAWADHIMCGVCTGGSFFFLELELIYLRGPGGSSGKALGHGLDGPGSIPGVGGVEIFLHSFVSRLALGSTQPPTK